MNNKAARLLILIINFKSSESYGRKNSKSEEKSWKTVTSKSHAFQANAIRNLQKNPTYYQQLLSVPSKRVTQK